MCGAVAGSRQMPARRPEQAPARQRSRVLSSGEGASLPGGVAATPRRGMTVENLLAELTTLGVALGAALGPTFVIELRRHADCCPIGVLTDGWPRLRFPLFVGGFRSVRVRLRSPEQPSKPAWHPYVAAPRLLLPVRHVSAPFGRPDPKAQPSRAASGPSLAVALRQHQRRGANSAALSRRTTLGGLQRGFESSARRSVRD